MTTGVVKWNSRVVVYTTDDNGKLVSARYLGHAEPFDHLTITSDVKLILTVMDDLKRQESKRETHE